MTPTTIALEAAGVLSPAAFGAPERWQLRPTTLTLRERRVALVGANGQGKTTLLRAIARLTPATHGRILLDGEDTARDEAALRRRLGYLFADTSAQLIMPTVREDVELSLRQRGLGKRERRAAAEALLHDAGLGHLIDRSVFELSGGERQRIALLGVLAVQPSVLLADEPTAALDLVHRHGVSSMLLGADVTLVVATHDLALAQECERALWIHGGEVVADGDPADVVRSYVDAAEARAPWPEHAP